MTRPNSTPVAAPLTLTAPTTTDVPLTLKGQTSQTAPLQNWLHPTNGVAYTRITADGNIELNCQSGTPAVIAFSGNTPYFPDGCSSTLIKSGASGLAYLQDGNTLGVKLSSNAVADGAQSAHILDSNLTLVSGNKLLSLRNNGAEQMSVGYDGMLGFVAANAQTTVGSAGGASALPATPAKFLKVRDSAGTTLVIPAYAAT